MPEYPPPKHVPHPAHRPRVPPPGRTSEVGYAELVATSNFSFLRGASHPEELVQRAARLGYRALGIADRNTLAGIVRAHVEAKDCGLPLATGARLALRDGPDTVVHPTDRASYGRLCRLLTLGKRRAEKGSCELALADLKEHAEGLLAIAVPPSLFDDPLATGEPFESAVRALREAFDDGRLSIAASFPYGPDDRGRLARLAELAARYDAPLVATNDAHYHVPARRALQDVLVCVREGCTIDAAGWRLFANAERHLKPPEAMAELFRDFPGALARSLELAERATSFSLDELRYRYPEELCPPGRTPMEHLRALTFEGARERYGEGGPTERVRARLEHEFALIEELDYPRYFLTVHDLVRYARSRGILCQGRGAAANSAVCYCLGVTSVDPDKVDLLFERFVSKERNEPPDIDVDFEHERREEVIQYLYRKYGRDRAALTAEVITYRGRSAIRDVGKALGLTPDVIDRLAKDLDWWHDELDPERIGARLRELGVDPEDAVVQKLFVLARELLGFPRHLSQHVGGFVITHDPLCELVPIENAAMADRTVIEWDKDDIDAMGMLKVDVLALGMLTACAKAFEMIELFEGGVAEDTWRRDSLAMHTIPPEDPAVYDMICRADTVGVFQIESRAQMSMLPRLRPRSFYDLVIEVAIVRPGPIHGDMVHPYLRRRNGEEPVEYPSEAVRRVLGKTLGVPLFQEQAMALAIVAAGFTAGEADELRRAMAAWKRKGHKLAAFRDKLIDGLKANGYDEGFAQRFFQQLQGFSEYGFPESHAASFALIVYVSAWLKHYHPAAFTAGLLNSQPMGFYAPAQLVRDAREHGVEVRGIDVNRSRWDCTLERLSPNEASGEPVLRLGLRMIKGLREDEAERIVAAVDARGPFQTMDELHRASGVRATTFVRLASADAFGSLGLDRRAALWQARVLRDAPADALPFEPEERALPALPAMSPAREVLRDYATTHLSLKSHPLVFLREELERRGATRAAELYDEARFPHGSRAASAGLVLCRQRPGTASGIVFMTLEDETAITNLIVHPKTFDRHRKVARHAKAVLARGRLERQGEVVHLIAFELEALDGEVAQVAYAARNFH